MKRLCGEVFRRYAGCLARRHIHSGANAADLVGAVAKMHPWEQECARKLNITANQYLTNKLLCFKRKYVRTQIGEGFTKTHAQQVATIDVNKVSKMWKVWERVGWLDNVWFNPKAVKMWVMH
jgi:SWIRM domain